mmetsp:Transcript_39750/g.124880  ORF Transcript_39750/g.124880 Transcript_39750/m.124880 type:complete len:226 (+) Transcript_39750:275-952(+)
MVVLLDGSCDEEAVNVVNKALDVLGAHTRPKAKRCLSATCPHLKHLVHVRSDTGLRTACSHNVHVGAGVCSHILEMFGRNGFAQLCVVLGVLERSASEVEPVPTGALPHLVDRSCLRLVCSVVLDARVVGPVRVYLNAFTGKTTKDGKGVSSVERVKVDAEEDVRELSSHLPHNRQHLWVVKVVIDKKDAGSSLVEHQLNVFRHLFFRESMHHNKDNGRTHCRMP